MTEEPKVKIPGVVLSAILHECMAGPHEGDVEGLLFGKASKRVVRVVQDSAADSQNEKVSLFIQTIVPLGSRCTFYSPNGALNTSVLEKIISTKRDQTFLGWYRFRRNVPLWPTMREFSVHKALTTYCKSSYPQLGSIAPIFAVFSHQVSADHIQYFDYQLFGMSSAGKMQPLRLEIMNLVSSSDVEYNEFSDVSSPLSIKPSASAQTSNDPFQRLNAALATLLGDSMKSFPPPHIQRLEKFYAATVSEIESLAATLSSSNQQIAELEKKLAELQRSGS